MTNRILDCSQQPASLSLRNGLIVIEIQGTEHSTIPIAELGAVILGHRAIRITGALLGALAASNVPVVCSDERMRPIGMLLPLEGMHAQSSRFRAQANLSLPAGKRIWQQIVQAKIKAQALVLEEVTGQDWGLRGFARRVCSGDPDNVEAQAARHYWLKLFPEDSFARRNEEDARNHFLDYGYAVLRATVARALCSCGLHPGIGIFHRSPYNTFPLADDLMEPFRPCVDRAVVATVRSAADSGPLELTPQVKKRLIESITARYQAAGESRVLIDWIQRAAQALTNAILNSECGPPKLDLPEWKPETEPAAPHFVEKRKNAARAVPDHVAIRDVRSAG